MRANNTTSMKYIKLIVVIPTKCICDLSVTSNFDSIKNNVTQTLSNLAGCKMAYCLLLEKTKSSPAKQHRLSGAKIADHSRFPHLAKYLPKQSLRN